MRSSLELEKKKFKYDDAADTEVSTVKYETGGRWLLPVGEAGDLEEKVEGYVSDQLATGEYKPLWQNRYWVYFFSRQLDDDYQLKQLKQRLEKESNE